MAFDRIKGLSPAMQGKYACEIIAKEQRDHLYHSLNVPPSARRSPSVPAANHKEFYAKTWRTLDRRYDQAAGVPSPLVDMARRFAGDPGAPPASRPTTGLSLQSRRSTSSTHSRALSVPVSRR
mmetsp:Transcript_99181/g.284952  ORF Transcript_99181/g.284952 Transcript_99181/m.284952 type:complete len:123 (-) Transcript_99181:164-532(-)